MTDFIIKQLPYDLSNQAGLALIGKYLKRINLNALVDPAFPVRSGIWFCRISGVRTNEVAFSMLRSNGQAIELICCGHG